LRVAEPKQALTIRGVDIGGKHVPADQVVWVHARGQEYAEVEYRERRGRVPLDAIVAYPVTGPELPALQKLDPCFGLSDEAFEREHISAEHFYELLRCRAHGRRFLRDVRGTSAWYSTTTLLADDEEGEPDEIWARYHWQSHSWLMLSGRTR
jgi:hypothetical protein